MGAAPRPAAVTVSGPLEQFYSDVVVGLSGPGQKELPSKYLYDELGSALFDAICLLPEYGLSRAESRLLQEYADEIVEKIADPVIVAELGSGSGEKTRLLLEKLSKRERIKYFPIDISGRALHRCRQELGQMERVTLVGFEHAYLDGLQEVVARRMGGERLLVLFLGSTIGNFDRVAAEQFLRQVRAILRSGDALLLATDLRKPVTTLLRAYDDPTGVTAAFNKNLLARINRELAADFDLGRFEHVVRYDSTEHRVEMHLRSTIGQWITIRSANFRCYMRPDETIWTESSHKYSAEEAIQMGERAGYSFASQWIDSAWPFAQTLLFAA